jgi:hypothetical protein
MVQGVKPKYITETKEEFAELETDIKLFLENYALKLNSIATINVKKGVLEKSVCIFPDKGDIEEIVLVTENPKGILRTATPEYVIVKIEEHQFMIRYRNPDEKKASR